MEKIKQIAIKCKKMGNLCATMFVDVKNAFNTVPWQVIINSMKPKGFPVYLINIVKEYFEDREIIIDRNTNKVQRFGTLPMTGLYMQ